MMMGQGEELAPLHEKAKKTGAEKLYIEDLRKEFVEDVYKRQQPIDFPSSSAPFRLMKAV